MSCRFDGRGTEVGRDVRLLVAFAELRKEGSVVETNLLPPAQFGADLALMVEQIAIPLVTGFPQFLAGLFPPRVQSCFLVGDEFRLERSANFSGSAPSFRAS